MSTTQNPQEPKEKPKKVFTAKEIASFKTNFLYAAIADAQGTIRATDSKIGLLMVMLIIPFTKLGTIYNKCSLLLENDNRILAQCATVHIVIFVFLWLLSFWAAIMAVNGIDDPSKHIDGEKPSGVFYSGGLFVPTFLDAFFKTQLLAKKQLQMQLRDLPTSIEALHNELIYEHAKVVYIRQMKMNRLKHAFIFGIAWVFCGGALWLLSLSFQN